MPDILTLKTRYLTDNLVRDLLTQCSETKELEIVGKNCGYYYERDKCGRDFNNLWFIAVGNTCHKLESLHLLGENDRYGFRGSWIGDAAFLAFTKGCPLLTSFECTDLNLNAKCVHFLVQYCPNLISVCFANILSDDGFLELANLISLTCLNIPSCDGSYSKVTDVVFIRVIQAIRNIEYLDITGCCNLTDESLKAISIYCPKLRTLILRNFSYCHFSSEGIDYIAEGCKLLSKRHIRHLYRQAEHEWDGDGSDGYHNGENENNFENDSSLDKPGWRYNFYEDSEDDYDGEGFVWNDAENNLE